MSTNDVIKSIKNALKGKYSVGIMLNFNITLSSFLAILRLKS